MTDVDFERAIDIASKRMAELVLPQVDLTVRAAIAEALPECPGGRDREKRLRVVEERVISHLSVAKRSDQTKVVFWWPLAVLVIGQLIITIATLWSKS